jgi:hypothetical protein
MFDNKTIKINQMTKFSALVTIFMAASAAATQAQT